MSVRLLAGKYENANSKRCMKPNVHTSTVYNSQDVEPKCPSTDEWVKMWYRHIYNIYMYIYTHTYFYDEILLSHKNEWNTAICSNMYGLRDDHTK